MQANASNIQILFTAIRRNGKDKWREGSFTENVPGNIIMERMKALCYGRAFFALIETPQILRFMIKFIRKVSDSEQT